VGQRKDGEGRAHSWYRVKAVKYRPLGGTA
jgi:hypothetical protein